MCVMAEVIDTPAKLGARIHRYPWDEWGDGQTRLLRLGEDFTVSVTSFVRHARRVAKARGCRLATAEAASRDRVIVMFVPLEGQGDG